MENQRRPETFDDSYDDDFDEDDDEGHADPQAGSKSAKLAKSKAKTKGQLISPDAVGLVKYCFHEAVQVLTHPVVFFEQMQTKGGLTEPIIFICLSASVYGLINAIGHLNPLVFFVSVASSLVYVLVGAFVASTIFSMGMGGRGDFESTLRVYAYSKATLLFAWIAVGSLQIGGWASIAYTMILNVIGLKQVQKLPTHVVAGIVVVLAVMQLVIKTLIKF